jgi:hypothetical protein
MADEKNIYVRQAEVKGSFKQSSNGTFLIGELTVNSTLKNYEKTLNRAFSITLAELEKRNSEYDEKVRQKKEKQKNGVMKNE